MTRKRQSYKHQIKIESLMSPPPFLKQRTARIILIILTVIYLLFAVLNLLLAFRSNTHPAMANRLLLASMPDLLIAGLCLLGRWLMSKRTRAECIAGALALGNPIRIAAHLRSESERERLFYRPSLFVCFVAFV